MNSNTSQATNNILYIRFYHISGAQCLHNFVTENLGIRVKQPTTIVHHRISLFDLYVEVKTQRKGKV